MSDAETQCDFCPESFKSKADWKSHNVFVHNTKVFVCEFCPDFFYDDGEYIQHYKTQHKSDFTARHQCEQCGVSYKYHKFLQSHIEKNHRIEQLIKCTKCGEEFCNTVAYNIHVKLKHEGKRKFHKCGECRRRFTSKEILRLHEKFDHNPNGRQYFKQYCNDNLDIHKEELKQLLKNSTKCTACSVKFSTAIDLYKHFKAVHGTKKYFQCCQCDDTKYVTRSGIGIHLTYEHGISRQHRCAICTTGHDKPPAPKNVAADTNGEESKTPAWSILYITNELPQNIELTDATDTQIENLRKNIRSMFHVLSTIPPSILKGEPKNNSIITVPTIKIPQLKPIRFNKHFEPKTVDFYQTEEFDESEKTVRKRTDREVLGSDRKQGKAQVYECIECKEKFCSSNALNIHTGTAHGKRSSNVVNDIESSVKRVKNSTIEINEALNTSAETDSTVDNIINESSDTDSLFNKINNISENDDVTVVIEILDDADPVDITNIFEQEPQIAHEGTQYKCNLCHTELSDQVTLLNHMTETHPRLRENLDTELFKCLVCGLGFRDEGDLNGHMKIHFDVSAQSVSTLRHECSACHKVFNDLRGLYLHHLRAHGMKTVYPCAKCQTEFTDKRKLRKHKMHCKVKQIFREKEVVDKENDIDKLKVVDKENDIDKLKDNEVMNQMKRKLLLMCKREMQQQKHRPDDKRIHKCLKCESKFTKRQLLLNHIRNEHNIQLNKLYKCSLCNSVFKMEDKLKQHIKLKHNEGKQRNIPLIKINKAKMSPVKLDKGRLPTVISSILSQSLLNGTMHSCKICNSYFPTKELLQRHIQWEHTKNVNLHKCGQCNEVMLSVDDLELHMSNTHNTFKWKKQIASLYEQRTTCTTDT